MTLEELYEQIGGNYAEAMDRMRMEKLVDRFVVKFLNDSSCENLLAAWSAGDQTAAFEAAHAAKGVCANLAITSIADPASEITEALRPGNDALRDQTDIDALIAQLEAAYKNAVDCITAYSETR